MKTETFIYLRHRNLRRKPQREIRLGKLWATKFTTGGACQPHRGRDRDAPRRVEREQVKRAILDQVFIYLVLTQGMFCGAAMGWFARNIYDLARAAWKGRRRG